MKSQNYVLAMSLLMLGACAFKKSEKKPIIYPANSPEVTTTNPKETSIIAKQLATEQGSNYVTELKFKKGDATISKADQSKIREIYQKAKKQGKINHAQLITWADQEFPTKEKEELADEQQDLVEKRNESLKKFITNLDKSVKVKKISMAERAGAIAKFTDSAEAEVKESLDVKDAHGRASEAIVIFIMKK